MQILSSYLLNINSHVALPCRFSKSRIPLIQHNILRGERIQWKEVVVFYISNKRTKLWYVVVQALPRPELPLYSNYRTLAVRDPFRASQYATATRLPAVEELLAALRSLGGGARSGVRVPLGGALDSRRKAAFAAVVASFGL